jgi:hypothetical protein
VELISHEGESSSHLAGFERVFTEFSVDFFRFFVGFWVSYGFFSGCSVFMVCQYLAFLRL